MAEPRVDTARLQRMSRAYTETATLWAAIDLGLFTAVANGASDEASVAEAIGISLLDAERLVVSCLTLDLLRHDEKGLRNPPDVARFLVEGEGAYAGPWLTFTSSAAPGWFQLAERMTSGEGPTTQPCGE